MVNQIQDLPHISDNKTRQKWTNLKKNDYEIVIIWWCCYQYTGYIFWQIVDAWIFQCGLLKLFVLLWPWLYKKKSFEFFIFTPRLPTYNQNRFRHISLFWCFTTVNQNWKSQLKIFAIYIWKFSWKFIVSLKIDGSIFRMIQFYC